MRDLHTARYPHPNAGEFVRGRLTPDLCDVYVSDGLPSLTIRGRSDRFTGWVLDALRGLRGFEIPSRRITVDLRESCGANAITIAEWIAECLGAPDA